VKPRVILWRLGVDPIIDKYELSICVAFIAEAVLRRSAGSFEGDLLTTLAIDTFS
jgi:hypothetical protein